MFYLLLLNINSGISFFACCAVVVHCPALFNNAVLICAWCDIFNVDLLLFVEI